MSSPSRSYAFFDIDGTLLSGFIIQNFPRHLVEAGFIESTYPDQIDSIITNYHSGNVSYRFAAENVPRLYAQAIKGTTIETVKHWAHTFMKVYRPTHIFSYAQSLVQRVASIVDMTIAISGSPREVVNELQDLGFDEVYGSTFEHHNGIYTGNVETNLILGEGKSDCIQQIANHFDIDFQKSIAFGDTDQDIPMLKMVKIPIAIQPNKALMKICNSKGWKWFNNKELVDIDQCIAWIKRHL